MTRVEYIRQLEFSLNGKLPRREISEILRDYSEYFEAGKAEGKTEEQIAVSLGIPSVVAAQILSENEEDAAREAKKEEKPIWYSKKERKKKMNPDRDAYFWEKWWEWIKGAWQKWFAFHPAGAASSAEEQAAGNTADAPTPPPPSPSPRAQRPRTQKGSAFFVKLLKLAGLLVLAPFALMAAGVGLMAAAALCFLYFCIIMVLVLGVLCAVFMAIAAAMAAVTLGTGGIALPFSFTMLVTMTVLFCLSGAVLCVCLITALFRWLGRGIRALFGRGKKANTARNPAYQAQNNTQDIPAAYTNGWPDLPVQESFAPAVQPGNDEAGQDAQPAGKLEQDPAILGDAVSGPQEKFTGLEGEYGRQPEEENGIPLGGESDLLNDQDKKEDGTDA